MTQSDRSSGVWDPVQYRRFEAERDRAALDLLLRLPGDLKPTQIWDLGCGAGHHAALMKRRFPDAEVCGLDASAAMLAEARTLNIAVNWKEGDIDDWAPERPVDLILANASLHWLDDHSALFPRLARNLAPGGVMAVQMPMAFETLHHRLLRETAVQGAWAEQLAAVTGVAPLLSAEAYYDALAEDCDEIDIWATTYLHALTGPDAVLEWMKGTAMRPYLTALDDDAAMQASFVARLGERLSQAFARRTDGATLMPFPRLFLMARRSGSDAAV